MIRRVVPAFALLALLLPAAARAQARVLQFRSAEDPASPPDPAVCDQAPFRANLRIGGSLFTYETREKTGRVIADDEPRAIGKATACARITSFLFPAGLQQDFLLQLTLPDGVYTAVGTCTIISNDVPVNGLVLAGCNLRITGKPDGVVGGAVTSVSTFNPFRLQGFATGSFWTAQIYDAASRRSENGDSERSMEWIEEGTHESGN